MNVEAGLKGIRENPLDEGMVSLKFLVIREPTKMHFIDVFTIGLGGNPIKIEQHVYIFGWFFLLDYHFWGV